MFIEEEFGEDSSSILADRTLTKAAFDLVKWASSKSKIDKLFYAFRKANLDSPLIAKLIDDRLIEEPLKKISRQEWDVLFANFREDDPLLKAYRRAFQDCGYSDSRDDRVREALEKCDKPKLTVAFANRSIEFIQKLDVDRDVSGISNWRDRIAETHQVDRTIGIENQGKSTYLLVSVNRQARGINLCAELHQTGKLPEPIDVESERRGIFCEFQSKDSDISQLMKEPLSQLLKEAEELLDNCHTFTLEIFLPWQHLNERVHEWEIFDVLGDSSRLSDEYAFIVRSLDRALNSKLKRDLAEKLQCLSDCIDQTSILSNFIELRDLDCKELFEITSLINLSLGKLGVKLAVGLPTIQEKRNEMLKALVKSSIPIALWVHETDTQVNCCQILQEFDNLLIAKNLKRFCELAKEIRSKRVIGNPIYHLGMLCDCPERMPTLSNQSNVSRARIPGN